MPLFDFIGLEQVIDQHPTNNNETNIFINLRYKLKQSFTQSVEDFTSNYMKRVFINKKFH